MKAIVLGTALFVALANEASAGTGSDFVVQRDNNLCIDNDHMHIVSIVDSRTIIFTMDDGTVWKNTLKEECPGLDAHSAVNWSAGTYTCGNDQSITVGRNKHVTCYLGSFTKIPAAH